jgi:glycosidase
MKSLEGQRYDDSSLFNYYRQAIAIRNALPVISHGDTFVAESLNIGCISAQRKVWNDQECIILMNIDANAAAVDLSAYSDWSLAASLSAEDSEITLDGTTLNLPPWGVAVFVKE